MAKMGKRKRHCLVYFTERRREKNKVTRLKALVRKATRRGWGEKVIQQMNTSIARADEQRLNPTKIIKAAKVEEKEETDGEA